MCSALSDLKPPQAGCPLFLESSSLVSSGNKSNCCQMPCIRGEKGAGLVCSTGFTPQLLPWQAPTPPLCVWLNLSYIQHWECGVWIPLGRTLLISLVLLSWALLFSVLVFQQPEPVYFLSYKDFSITCLLITPFLFSMANFCLFLSIHYLRRGRIVGSGSILTQISHMGTSLS